MTFADGYAGHVKAFCTSGGAFCSAKRCTTDYLLGIRTLHRGSGSFPEAKRLELLFGDETEDGLNVIDAYGRTAVLRFEENGN